MDTRHFMPWVEGWRRWATGSGEDTPLQPSHMTEGDNHLLLGAFLHGNCVAYVSVPFDPRTGEPWEPTAHSTGEFGLSGWAAACRYAKGE